MEAFECWGYKKRKTGLVHPWQRRYFRYDTGSTEMTYYKSPSTTKARGIIDCLQIVRLSPTDDGMKNMRDPAVKSFGAFSLDIHTSEPRVFHIIFESQANLDTWLVTLWALVDRAKCKLHASFANKIESMIKTVGAGGGGEKPVLVKVSSPRALATEEPISSLKDFIKGLPVPVYMKLVRNGFLHQSGDSVLTRIPFDAVGDYFETVRQLSLSPSLLSLTCAPLFLCLKKISLSRTPTHMCTRLNK